MNDSSIIFDQTELDYFFDQLERDNHEFEQRIGYSDYKGKTVLDIGCGHGALSVYIASLGAKRVVGVDINRSRIEFAKRIIEFKYPEYSSVINFECCPLVEISGKFDIAISKDSFEHIEDLPAMMRDIAARLHEGGLLITGFSPLYFSPFGDHGRYTGRKGRRIIPWLPAMLPEPLLFLLSSHLRKVQVRSAADVWLNKLTPKQFRKIVSDQGWVPDMIEYNKGERLGMPLMRLLRQIPILEKFFTVSIYAQLRTPHNRQI
ncbi:class I SAM-dependent methyltransferase [Desulfosarcina alkanivorans]|uniref:class I SAM-dependent methyltransferase n=1 Tax=Desulfosarcina alkanivorans TaxID=571177 RepID=UPI0012D370F9|nr:class I SAM-dependent methyltransferase [Desulfosarcina alkanivorans]